MVIGVCGRYTFFTDKELQEVDEIIGKINEEIRQEKMKTGEYRLLIRCRF